jgi:hypothetical protein
MNYKELSKKFALSYVMGMAIGFSAVGAHSLLGQVRFRGS